MEHANNGSQRLCCNSSEQKRPAWFGSEWNEEISGDWTGQCMNDYLSAIDDACKNLPFVDKDRLGAVGASFGGFSVYYLAGHHNKRFKCFIRS